MPDDQLNSGAGAGTGGPDGPGVTPRETARSVLAVLAGVPLDQAAARIGMEPADLADAVEAYQAAGYAALHAQAAARDGWYQVRVEFTDWNAAEQIAATRISPHLEQSQDAGLVTSWWFTRKAPCWRLRLRSASYARSGDMKEVVGSFLDGLTAAGLIKGWREGIYEPETCAFGGPRGMRVAHDLFHADSRTVLRYLTLPALAVPPGPALGRRELSVLLCSVLFRGAGQDWHEQGDIWHRVTDLRPLPPDVPASRLGEMIGGLRRLMTLAVDPAGPLVGPPGPLASAAPWAAAFDEAGQSLGAAASDGTLERGVRDILAHHVIFHWNRLGLATRTQAILAQAACQTVMGQPLAAPADGQ
jgi:thiopeptide-type bacteriocin biosynthesis protein